MGAKIRAARELIADTMHEALPGQPFADSVMRSVNSAVGFDGYCIFAVDPITGLRCAMFSHYGLEVSALRHLHNETVEHDVNRYADLVRRPGHAGVLAMRTAPEPHSPRLHEMLRPHGYESELRLALVADGRYWGAMVLFRDELRHPFTDTDMEVAAALSGALSLALRRHQVRRPEIEPDARPAGVVLVGRDRQLLTVSPEAQTWLGQLTSGGPDGVTIDDASRVVYEVALAAADGRRDPVCRVRTTDGRWLVISGTKTHAPPVEVTVVIQPASLHQTLPAFGAWCGLTHREAQVLELVADGLAAKQMARRLDLSVLTVNDHLRSTYRKAGISGREELLAVAT
jgi:DNA-binding CsgD family transcriptional regulator